MQKHKFVSISLTAQFSTHRVSKNIQKYFQKNFPLPKLVAILNIFLVVLSICIHRIASGGDYGFCFVMLPPQCVEIFHRYHSNEKSIIDSLLKFSGYIHNHKILPGNIFGLILKNKMAATGNHGLGIF